ncbi:MAG: sulfatase family protein [Verrucomicrobiales bacterium]
MKLRLKPPVQWASSPLLTLLLALLALLAFLPLGAAERPNFLIIFTDDLGYGDVSTYQDSDCQTPHLDQLAKEGLLFTAMRANCTVCSPSRAALLTGKNADCVGVPGVIRSDKKNSWGYFDPAARTLADELNAAGYHSAAIGKWHLGLEAENHPNKRGFTHFHGFLGDMMDDYYTHRRRGENLMRLNGETITPKGHATELFSDWAISYFAERAEKKDEPFFLYLAYNAPHFPIQPPAEWLEKVKQRRPDLPAKRAANVAFVEHLDHEIGRVLAALEKEGLAENTLVAFASDNGGSIPHAQSNKPWREGKQWHYDGGLRTPFTLRWPAKIPAGSTSDYAGLNFDLFPTFLELAGAKPTADLDARSLVPLLNGGEMPQQRELYFVRREGGSRFGGQAYHALISGDWKLLRNNPYQPLELYHLADDPQEKNNLASQRKDLMKKLAPRLQHHIQRGGATPWQK